jgi:hypothetical protein
LRRLNSQRGLHDRTREVFHGAGEHIEEGSFIHRSGGGVGDEISDGGSQNHSIFETVRSVNPSELEGDCEERILGFGKMKLNLGKVAVERFTAGSLRDAFPLSRRSRGDGRVWVWEGLRRSNPLSRNFIEELKNELRGELKLVSGSERADQLLQESEERAK